MDFTTRNVDEILNGVLPKKSDTKYKERWDTFAKFAAGKEPNEEMFLQFFDYLRRERNYKASTLWT